MGMLRVLVPARLRNALRQRRARRSLVANFMYDAQRFLRHSTTVRKSPADFEQLEAQIMAHLHAIERGLSLPGVSPGFGQATAKSLLGLLRLYMANRYPVDGTSVKAALSSLREYVRFHQDNGYDMSALGKDLDALAIPEDETYGGTVVLSIDDILRYSREDFLQCSRSRHSIRCFSGERVDLTLVNEAIRIAQTTPSVCNRQSSRVYIVQNEKSKQAVLDLQPGNRGFGHLADKILVVTSDLRAFSGIHERNQAFIDGGMFAMSLLYSLHYLGLGACALSWMVRKEVDEKILKLLEIHDAEVVVVLIAVGHLPHKLRVPVSARKKLDEVLRVR